MSLSRTLVRKGFLALGRDEVNVFFCPTLLGFLRERIFLIVLYSMFNALRH